MRDFSGKTGKLHEDREGQIKICFPPLPTAHPCLINEGNVNYLLPHGGAAPATGPGVQEGKNRREQSGQSSTSTAHPCTAPNHTLQQGRGQKSESIPIPEPPWIYGTPGRFEVTLNHSKTRTKAAREPCQKITPDILIPTRRNSRAACWRWSLI